MVVMDKTKTTTIQLSIETRDELSAMGSKGETYDIIVKRLIRVCKESKHSK
jgi:hypothetical protein